MAINTHRASRIFGVAIALLPIPRSAAAQQPISGGVVSSGSLTFDGHANVGDFTGITTEISGQLTGGADIAAVRGWVETPVRSIKTGNDHRDRDLNKSMASDRFPDLRFELTSISSDAVSRGDSVNALLHGTFSAHGVTRDVDVPAAIIVGSDSTIVHGQFPLNLKDYQIGGLGKFLGILKMDEHIVVHVAVAFRSSAVRRATASVR